MEFMIQRRPQTSLNLSVEDSRMEWLEIDAPFERVAQIDIPPQDFDTEDRKMLCENLSFNPWHSLPEHRPLGAVNRVRKIVYSHIRQTRHQLNQVQYANP
jgi:hypothetical protein